MTNPIYADKEKSEKHSLRYISILTHNVTGILNRIASLMRRKRFNIEEVSLNFDNENKAHFVLAIDGELFDIQQIIHQIEKLHDVLDVYDATHQKDYLFNGIYVNADSESEFKKFPIKAVNVINKDGHSRGIFMLPLEEVPSFVEFLNKNGYYYAKRLLSLI